MAGRSGGGFVIALRTRNMARTRPARRRIGELVRAAPPLAALALPGCAPVGPNFERPAALVSPQFKEIKGWKIATPRVNEPKGEWWSVFHDPELDQPRASRRRIQSDGQVGRSRLSRGAGAHQRGARRALSHDQRDWLRDAFLAGHHDFSPPKRRGCGRSTSGVRSGARSRRSRRARKRAPPISPTRCSPRNRCWRSRT